MNLGENFRLPDPITTPGYVPSPPKAKIDQISVQGASQISFSEPVFELQNLETAKVKIPKEPLRRALQASAGKFEFEFDEKPFI